MRTELNTHQPTYPLQEIHNSERKKANYASILTSNYTHATHNKLAVKSFKDWARLENFRTTVTNRNCIDDKKEQKKLRNIYHPASCSTAYVMTTCTLASEYQLYRET
jgi:hypothetical protein